MNKLMMNICLSAVIFSGAAFAGTDSTNTEANTGVTFQVIKTQIEIPKESIKSAELIKGENNKYSVMIKLSPSATNQLNELSKNNLNQMMNLVWNKHVLSSAVIISELGGNFQISNLTLNEAEPFVKSLHKVKF